jgi:glutaconyl-CoA/methylmalonyl-CoA decarboxylase subunit delta
MKRKSILFILAWAMLPVLMFLPFGLMALDNSSKNLNGSDPWGIGMMVVTMIIVLIALIVMYIVFRYVARIYTMDLRKRFLKKKGKEEQEGKLPSIQDTTGELGAAIGLALYYYQNQLHDHENAILTIQKVGRIYSPWSSKIYGILKSLK